MTVPSKSNAAILQCSSGLRLRPWRQVFFFPKGGSHLKGPQVSFAFAKSFEKKGWTVGNMRNTSPRKRHIITLLWRRFFGMWFFCRPFRFLYRGWMDKTRPPYESHLTHWTSCLAFELWKDWVPTGPTGQLANHQIFTWLLYLLICGYYSGGYITARLCISDDKWHRFQRSYQPPSSLLRMQSSCVQYRLFDN